MPSICGCSAIRVSPASSSSSGSESRSRSWSIAFNASARYIAPVSRFRNPNRRARCAASVLLPAPAGPSIAITGRVRRATSAASSGFAAEVVLIAYSPAAASSVRRASPRNSCRRTDPRACLRNSSAVPLPCRETHLHPAAYTPASVPHRILCRRRPRCLRKLPLVRIRRSRLVRPLRQRPLPAIFNARRKRPLRKTPRPTLRTARRISPLRETPLARPRRIRLLRERPLTTTVTLTWRVRLLRIRPLPATLARRIRPLRKRLLPTLPARREYGALPRTSTALCPKRLRSKRLRSKRSWPQKASPPPAFAPKLRGFASPAGRS